MIKMSKKIISVTTIITLLLSNIQIPVIFAWWSLNIESLQVNWLTTPLSAMPGDSFKVALNWINNWTENLTSVYWNIYFSDNNSFIYNWNNKALIWFTTIKDPILAWDYNNSTWLYTEITDSANPTILVWKKPRIWWTANNNFTISQDISTYENFIYGKFNWLDTTSNPIISPVWQNTIYVNVKPHITDYYFEKDWSITTAIAWDWEDTVNLVVKVKDYNGCPNIDEWTINANLSQLWLSNSESLIYQSCESDWKTAIFKKTWITTIAFTWDKTFSVSDFQARDENWNSNNPDDWNTTFDDEDKKTSISISVTSPNVPKVSISSITDNYIWWPTNQNSTINFSGTKDWQVKVAIWSSTKCEWGTTLLDWTWSGSYIANTQTGITISSNNLQDWNNNIYLCIANTDWTWSISTTITKDTISPSISEITVSPSNVTTENSNVSYKCNENWVYQIELRWDWTLWNWTFIWSGSVSADNTISKTIPAWSILVWTNKVNMFCIDNASNIATYSWTINKIWPTPSMSGQVLSIADNDINYDWIDWRDISITWDNTWALNFASFESYRIYVLPSSVDFNTWAQSYVKILPDKTQTWITFNSTLLKDSTNTDLVSGASYKACIAIMATSWQLWWIWCSPAWVLTGDIVQHPTITSAKFTSNTNLELTTDATISSTLSNNSWSLVSYQIWATTYTWITVSSVNGNKINITIPTIWNTSATWGNLTVHTWVINASAGWFNNYFYSWSIVITDWQAPTIQIFSTWTTSSYNWFYTWSIAFNYTISENLAWAWNTKIVFTRIWWNSDSGSPRTFNITNPADLTSGSKTININLANLWLISWTYYDVQFIASDTSLNQTNSSILSNIKFDNSGPDVMSITPFWPSWVLWIVNPIFQWFTTTDNFWNWSWVKWYKFLLYNSSTCTWTPTITDVSNSSTLQNQTTLANLNNYAWTIYAYDNMWNTWGTSTCDNFYINTLVPWFSNPQIKDLTLNSTSYTRWGNNLEAKSTITSTNSSHIWLDASSLLGWSYSNIQCSAPTGWITCNYSSNIVTYNLPWVSSWLSSWVKQVRFTATNTSWINTGSTLGSITVDNTVPNISWTPITAPINSTIWWWTGQSITWNTAAITDNIWISYLKFDYSTDWWTNWNLIWTWANTSPYNWNTTSLVSWSNYKVRITAYDTVWNPNLTTSDTFQIDKIAPVIQANTITTPNSNSILKWWASTTISWTTWNITDNISIWTNPITLSYSTDWTNWSPIASNLLNNWSYNWTIPAINSNTVSIKITAKDTAWNQSTQISPNFVIDSTTPVQNITYVSNWWTTPQNGKYINNSWIDLSVGSTDTYLDKIQYSFQNLSNTNYWNWTSWTGTQVWNNICSDWTIWWTSWNCWNITQFINPTSISNWTSYRMIIRTTDEAWNTTIWNNIDYVWDTVNPNLLVYNTNWSYFSGSINISWTASDAGSNLSSTKIEIKRAWNEWWNWTTWVGTQQLLATSWTPWNWNYSFAAPVWDSDLQQYLVNVATYDQAYKTNNSTATWIYITKDITWPNIDNSIFTFNTWAIYKWWQNLSITWNTWSITTSGATLSPNSIKLEYNFTGTIVTIADNLPNTWNYNFILPTADTTTAKIIISAKDSIWNNSNTVSSSNFVIDSTPPTIEKVETKDFDANGQIDWLLVTFSENVYPYSSISTGGFSVSNWITLSWASSPDNAKELRLDFGSNYWDTSSTPTLTYSGVNIVDIADNKLANTSQISIDKASPLITSSEIYDTNSNWKIDQVKVYFSENMPVNTNLSSWTINNKIAWVTESSISTSSNYALLNISEPTDYNTSTWWMDLSFVNNWTWKDISNNSVWNISNLQLIDKAAPKVINSSTLDSNSNYKIDKIEVSLSEGVTWTMTWFTLSNLSWAIYTGSINQVWNKIFLEIWETTFDNDTWVVPTWAYSGWYLKDSNNNTLANVANIWIIDWVKPKLLSKETVDSNNNWKIDQIKYIFSENLKWTTWWINILVSGYNINTYSTTTNNLFVTVDEKEIHDWNQTPNTQMLSNSTLWDMAWNLANIESSSSIASDKIWPVIVFARYDSSSKIIYANLSENFSWSINNSDILINWWTATIGTISATSGTNTMQIQLSWTPTITLGTTSMSFVANTIWDLLGNKQTTTYYTPILGSVVINEIMHADSNNQYIELKNLSNSSIDISGWIIKNAWWNWINITLPASQTLWANSFYLITKTGISSLSWVIADYNTTLNLNTTTQNSLILNNWSFDLDWAKANPWPNWNTTLVSMERNLTPWDWIISSNWHDWVASEWFINTSYKWTPKSENITDNEWPFVTSNIADNTLFPIWNVNIIYNYTDTGWINSNPNFDYKLEKWNWASWVISWTPTSSWVTSSQANFNYNNLEFGKYRATFWIYDSSSNVWQKVTIFYVDKVEVTITNPTINIWNIDSSWLFIWTGESIITVKTLWAWLNVRIAWTWSMVSGINYISPWNWSEWFWFDYNETWDWNNTSYNWTIAAINSTSLSNYIKSINTNWTQNTYTYKVKFWAKVNSMQIAWLYNSTPKFDFIFSY